MPLVSGEPVAGTYFFLFFFPGVLVASASPLRCACVCAVLGLWCVLMSFAMRLLRGSLLCRVLASTSARVAACPRCVLSRALKVASALHTVDWSAALQCVRCVCASVCSLPCRVSLAFSLVPFASCCVRVCCVCASACRGIASALGRVCSMSRREKCLRVAFCLLERCILFVGALHYVCVAIRPPCLRLSLPWYLFRCVVVPALCSRGPSALCCMYIVSAFAGLARAQLLLRRCACAVFARSVCAALHVHFG